MISALSVVKEEISPAKEEISVVKEEVSPAKEEISVVKEEVSLAKGEISVVKEEVSLAKGEISVVKEEISPAKGEISVVKEEISPAKEEISVDGATFSVVTVAARGFAGTITTHRALSSVVMSNTSTLKAGLSGREAAFRSRTAWRGFCPSCRSNGEGGAWGLPITRATPDGTCRHTLLRPSIPAFSDTSALFRPWHP